MKKFFIQIAALLIFIAVLMIYSSSSLFGLNSKKAGDSAQTSTNTTKTEPIGIGNTKINAEIADTAELRQKGLGGRASIASDSGMLFIFDKSGVHSFWMKGMEFSLDFIWINNHKVVDLIKNIPPPEPNQTDTSLPIYQSTQPVDSVLEVNRGFVDANGIKVGDDITAGNL